MQSGIDVQLDLWADDRRRDWSAWASAQLSAADFVLIVASPAYKRRAEGLAAPHEGRGAQYEAAIIRDRLTENRDVWVPRMLPVVLPGGSVSDIPGFLQPYASTRYEIDSLTGAGIEDLLRVLTGQPRYRKPALGPVPRLPPRGAANAGDSGWRLPDSAEFLTHWLPRSRGVEPDAGKSGWYFVGRQRALRELAGWLARPAAEAGDRRMRVVTGSPGSGKSSVLAHLLVLADRETRERVPDVYKSDLPPGLTGAVSVAVLARDKDVGAVVREIAAAARVTATTPTELLVALSERGQPFTIVADALDEALPEQIPHIARLLNRLASDPDGTGIRVLVAVRSALAGSPLDSATRDLGSRTVPVPVDREPYLVRADVAAYVRRRLLLDGHPEGQSPGVSRARTGPAERTPYQDSPELAERVARAVAERSRGNFLVAQLVSRFLAEDPEPVDVSRDGWSAQFPETVDAALSEYIARFGDLERQQWARDLLTPLAFATGQGLPDNQLWAALATALSRPRRTYRSADVHELMDTAAAYLVDRSGAGQHHAFRLYHSAMDQYLRDHCRVADAAGTFAATLVSSVPVGRDGTREWAAADPYLLAHLSEHAARAGAGVLEDVLADPEFLAYGEPTGLLRVMSGVSAASRGTARVYQVAAHFLEGEPVERAAYLTMVALQLGEERLAAGLRRVLGRGPWTVIACNWEPPEDYQVIMKLDVATTVTALASRRPGHVLVLAGDAAGRVQLHRWTDGIAESDEPSEAYPSAVTALAVAGSPDGRLAVLAGYQDGSVRLWHVDDDLLIPVGARLPAAHPDAVTAAAFGSGPAGHEAAVTGDRAGNLRRWQVSGNGLTRLLDGGGGGQFTAVALLREPSGDECVLSGDSAIRLWRPTPAAGLAEQEVMPAPIGAQRTIGAIVLHADAAGAVALIGTGEGDLYRRSVGASGFRSAAAEFQAMNSGISALQTAGQASSRQDIFATGSADGDVTLVHNPGGGPIAAGDLNLYQQVRAHEGRVRSILLSDGADGGLTVTSAAEDRQVVTWTAQAVPQPLTGMWEMRKAGINVAPTCCDGPYPALSLLYREVPAFSGSELWVFDGGAFIDFSEVNDVAGWAPVRPALVSEGMRTTRYPVGTQWHDEGSRAAIMLEQSAADMSYFQGSYLLVRASALGNLVVSALSLDNLEARSYAGSPGKAQGQKWIESLTISRAAGTPLLATGAASGTLDLWAIDGTALTRLSEPVKLSQPGPRLGFVHQPDGEPRLLAGDSLGTLGLLTVADGRLRPGGERWLAHGRPITAVAGTAAPDGQVTVIAGDTSGLVTLWRLDPVGPPTTPALRIQLGSRVASLTFAGPDSFIAWCKQGAVVVRWDKHG